MAAELPDEAAGRAPGRGRLNGRRVLVVGAGTRATADPDAPIGNGRAIATLAGLVLNVGIGQGIRLEGTSVEDWDATFAVNVRAHFLVCRAALPDLPDGASVV